MSETITASQVHTKLAILRTEESYMRARQHGLVILDLNLSPSDTEPLPDQPAEGDRVAGMAYALASRAAFDHRVDLFYSDPARAAAELDASFTISHTNSPTGIIGDHGFPRWADYYETDRDDIKGVEQSMILHAERSRHPLGLKKEFHLGRSALKTFTTLSNGGTSGENASLGERLCFNLAWEDLHGLRINGQDIYKLAGKEACTDLHNQEEIFLDGFGGQAEIQFPAGHVVGLTAAFTGYTDIPLSMRLWRRRGRPFICIDALVGINEERNNGIMVVPGIDATLTTRIELLHSNPKRAAALQERRLNQAVSREPAQTPPRRPA